MSKKTKNPPAERGKPKTPEQRDKLAKLLKQGVRVGEALEAVGYGPNAVAKGWDAVPDVVKVQLPKKATRLLKLGGTDKDIRKKLIRGRLLENTLNGKDGGAMSAKILGSDSELNMWTPDFQTGIIVLNCPQISEEQKRAMLADCEPVPLAEERQR